MTVTSNTTTTSLPWLETLLHDVTANSLRKPIAVFDCDGTIIKGDIGEAMFFYQLERGLFRVSPADAWTDHPDRKNLDFLFQKMNDTGDNTGFSTVALDWYFGQLREGKTAKACSDIVRLLAGFSLDEVRSIARDTLTAELSAPVGHRKLGGQTLPRGIRFIRETVEILNELKRAGFEIHVVSGSNKWSVEAVFAPFDIPSEHIVGIEAVEKDGLLTTTIKDPVPVLNGKVEILRKRLPNKPDIVLSDSLRYDLPLLDEASRVKVHVLSSQNGNADFDCNDTKWVQLQPVSLIEHGDAWPM